MRIIIELWRAAFGIDIFCKNFQLRCLIYFGIHAGIYKWSLHAEVYKPFGESIAFNIKLPFFHLDNDTTQRSTVTDTVSTEYGDGYKMSVKPVIVGHLAWWKIGEVK